MENNYRVCGVFFPEPRAEVYCVRLNLNLVYYSGQNVQNFLTVVRNQEDDLGNSMLPASIILENCCSSAFSDIEYIFRVGNH